MRTSTFGRTAAVVAAGLLLTAPVLAGCGISKVAGTLHKASQRLERNQHTIDQFTAGLKSGSTTFAATYQTTGDQPSRTLYAVDPGRNAVSFRETSSAGASRSFLLANPTGEYSCSPPAAAGHWTCEKLGHGTGLTDRSAVALYTPEHWVGFLHAFTLGTSFLGEKVSLTRMSEHGFALKCVTFRTPHTTFRSRVCTTSQGILGLVQTAPDATSFEIVRYTASPSPALFRIPAGARVTRAGGHSG